MIPGLLLFFVLFVLFFSYESYPTQFSATASAIRQIWSGSCRLQCQPSSEAISFTTCSEASGGCHSRQEAGVTCVCVSCPCQHIENVLRRCGPLRSVYSATIYHIFNFLHFIFTMPQKLFSSTSYLPESATEIASAVQSALAQGAQKIGLTDGKSDKKHEGDTSSVSSVVAEVGSSRGGSKNMKSTASTDTLTPGVQVKSCAKCAKKGNVCSKECPKAVFTEKKKDDKDKKQVDPNIPPADAADAKKDLKISDEKEKDSKKHDKSDIQNKGDPKSEDKNSDKKQDTKDRKKEDSKKHDKSDLQNKGDPKNEDNSDKAKEDTKDEGELKDKVPCISESQACSSKCTKCTAKGVPCGSKCPRMAQKKENQKRVASEVTTPPAVAVQFPDAEVDSSKRCCGSEVCASSCPKSKCGQGLDQETMLDRYLNLSEEVQIPSVIRTSIKCISTKCKKGSKQLQILYPPKDKNETVIKVLDRNSQSNVSIQKILTGLNRDLKLSDTTSNTSQTKPKSGTNTSEDGKLEVGPANANSPTKGGKCGASLPCISIKCNLHNQQADAKPEYLLGSDYVIEPEDAVERSHNERNSPETSTKYLAGQCSKCKLHMKKGCSRSCPRRRTSEEDAKQGILTIVASPSVSYLSLAIDASRFKPPEEKSKEDIKKENRGCESKLGPVKIVSIENLLRECELCRAKGKPCKPDCPNKKKPMSVDEFVIDYK